MKHTNNTLKTAGSLTAALILAVILLAGSTSAEPRGRFGIISGLNIAGSYGCFLMIPVSQSVYFRPEFLYSQKGTQSTIYFDGDPIEVRGKVDYIEVPVLFDVVFPTNSSVSPHITVGPSFAYNVLAKVEGANTSFDVSNIASSDVGLVLGGGLAFGSSKSLFFVDVRYTLGLTRIFKDLGPGDVIPPGEIAVAWPETGRGLQYKNAVFSAMVGLAF
jgi:hypothetical protein